MKAHDPNPASRTHLSVARSDLERVLMCPAGRFTQPGLVLPLILGAVGAVGFYGSLLLVGDVLPRFTASFRDRGYVPYAIVAFSMWALGLIVVKLCKVRLQSRALNHDVAPDEAAYVLSEQSVEAMLDRLYRIADDPREFILYNRLHVALSNLRNMGRIGDVDDVLRSRAQADEAAADSSYTVLRGLIWAIPVLGFIGTVLGLSQAIGHFGAVLAQSQAQTETLKASLVDVTAGLSVAFETTLQALVAALAIQLLMTFVRRHEESMFDRFHEYCERQVIAHLRLRPQEPPR